MKSTYHTRATILLHLLERARNGQGGYSLVITMASIVILGSLLVTAALISKVDSSSTDASITSNSGFYAADAGLRLRANDIRETFIGFNRPEGPGPARWEDCIDGDSSNDGENDFSCDTSISINDQQIVTFVEEPNLGRPSSIVIEDGAFRGLSAQEYRYDVVSVALNEEGTQTSPTSILGMRFKSRLVPVFQFAAFYEQDLDLFAPPTMTLNGRVHSNNNLYLNSGSSNLNITGIVSTGQTLYHGEKWDDLCYDTVSIATSDNPASLSPLTGCVSGGGRVSYTQSDVDGTWRDRIYINSDQLKLPDLDNYRMPPDNVIGDSQTVEEDFVYWDRADIRLVLELNNSNEPTGIKIVNTNGTTNTDATNTLNSCIPVNSTSGSPISSTLSAPALVNTNEITVASTSGFEVGDAIQIGTDFDSNVIAEIPDSNTIILKRRLDHAYQSALGSTIANVGATVKKATVWTSDTFYNYREKEGSTALNANDQGRFIRMLNVDVQGFLNCIDANVGSNGIMGDKELSEDSDGGMVWFLGVDGPDSHVDITDGDSPNNYGIRVYNGETLASTNSGAEEVKGLTVVTDQAMYIQGNYNSSGTKRPASFVTDTLNILSEAWTLDDGNGYAYDSTTNLQTTPTYIVPRNGWVRSPKEAKHTTINAAFFAGIDVTGGGNDSSTTQDQGFASLGGGLNNYPRMHEEWTLSFNCPTSTQSYGICTLEIKGSLVSFGAATRVNGDYCGSHHDGCNIYHPPRRDWSFDTDFEQAQNLPPLTPRAVYITQEIFERDFTYTGSESNSFSLASLLPGSEKSLWQPKQKQPFLTAFSF